MLSLLLLLLALIMLSLLLLLLALIMLLLLLLLLQPSQVAKGNEYTFRARKRACNLVRWSLGTGCMNRDPSGWRISRPSQAAYVIPSMLTICLRLSNERPDMMQTDTDGVCDSWLSTIRVPSGSTALSGCDATGARVPS